MARLPNGEGTRAAVCELLKDSQYLADSSDSQINNVVSGALDRLHYEKDPCIKYDVNRKLWIYLHKERTKEEFGKKINVKPETSCHFRNPLCVSLACYLVKALFLFPASM